MSEPGATREQAIPGEWTALVLIIVIGAALGFLVLWFTMRRHERVVLHRAEQRDDEETCLIGDAETAGLFTDAATTTAAAAANDDPAGVPDTQDAADTE